MAIRAALARRLFACFLTVATAAAVAPAAMAQHVVTDNEAGKLTFDALTATPQPIVHRVMWRPLRSAWSEQIRQRSVHGFHTVAFRREVREPIHFALSHRRRRG